MESLNRSGAGGSGGRALAASLAAQAQEGEAQAVQDAAVTATAVIKRCDSQETIGGARLSERVSSEGVKIVEVGIGIRAGLPEGRHAVHIHETGQCEPCSAARGHFDPGPNGNSSPDGNHPFHSGDLVNLDINDMGGGVTLDDGTPLGSGSLRTITTRVTLSPGHCRCSTRTAAPSSSTSTRTRTARAAKRRVARVEDGRPAESSSGTTRRRRGAGEESPPLQPFASRSPIKPRRPVSSTRAMPLC